MGTMNVMYNNLRISEVKVLQGRKSELTKLVKIFTTLVHSADQTKS